MGCYLKIKNQPLFLYRGKKVETKEQATWYSSKYAAETMRLRWEKAHPRQKLEIRKWSTDEVVNQSPATVKHKKPASWSK
jgi:hypothetical protein